MRTRRKSIIVVSALAACALALGACSSSGSKSSGGSSGGSSGSASGGSSGGADILIGLDCDTTGPGAGYATPSCNATKGAIDYINNNGGVLGGRKLKYIQDSDESDPTKTPTVLQKFVSQGAKAIFALTSSAGVLQAKAQIERTKVPVIMSVASNPLVTQAPNNTYLWELAASTAQWAQALCQGLQAQGIKTLAAIQDNSPAEVQFNKGFFAALNCVKITTQTAPIDATDLSAEVARIKSSKPDAVLVGTSSNNFEILAQNTLFQQMPSTPRFTESQLSANPSLWKQAAPGALNGLVGFAGLTDTNPQTKTVQDYYSKTQQSNYTSSQFWNESWDGVQLLAQAIKAANSDDPARINSAWMSIKGYKASFGYPGFTLSFSADKHLGADGLCGEVLVEWGPDNTIKGPWSKYTPQCSGS